MGHPQVRNPVHHRQPDDLPRNERQIARVPQPGDDHGALLVLVVRQHLHAVQHPHQRRLHQRAVQEVHGEAHPPQEQQVPAAQRALQPRAEEDPEGDELEAYAGPEPREVWVLGQDGPHHVEQDARPGHPLGVALREGGEGEAGEDEGE